MPNTYCAVNLSFFLIAAPVPLIRSATSSDLDGAVVGMTMVGALPEVPPGDAHAMVANPVTAKADVEHFVETVPMVVVVVAIVVGMVTVGGLDFVKKRAADPMTRMATTSAMTPRRRLWRRLFFFCIASIF